MPLLVTRLINVTGVFLYPAYCSYKALARRPAGGLAAQDADLERWLQYWSLVGAWTALEGAVGWFLEWLPFYTLVKTAIFLYLAISSTGTPYVYSTFLAPLFAENEPAIDEFIGGIRGQAGARARGGLGWVYERIRIALGAAYASGAVGQQGGFPFAPSGSSSAPGSGFGAPGAGPAMGPQPPRLSDPASGAVQHAAGMLQGLASRYLPQALAAVSAAAGSAQQTAARGFDVPPPHVPHSVFQTTPEARTAPAGSRTFAYARDEVYASSRGAGSEADARSRNSNLDPSRTPSDASLSGGSGSNLASSFTEIRREEAEGADARPVQQRRTSNSWMSWGSTTPKEKAQ